MTNPTRYSRPATLQEAIRLSQEPDAIALAGGALTFGKTLLPHAHVIDLQDVAQLNAIEVTESALLLGGAVRLQAVALEQRRARMRGGCSGRCSAGETTSASSAMSWPTCSQYLICSICQARNAIGFS